MERVSRTEDIDDWAFDEELSLALRIRSSTHFTPVAVARLAARLLAPQPGMVVLDVGAGVGKFCITAAREVETAMFVGVEWRPHLVHVASAIRRRYALKNVRFVLGDAFDLDWSAFDAFYFYNPFAEQLLESAFALDDTIEFHPANFMRYIACVQRRLAMARVGTRIVTYHGFGGLPPAGYELAREDRIGSDRVELWLKTRSTAETQEAS